MKNVISILLPRPNENTRFWDLYVAGIEKALQDKHLENIEIHTFRHSHLDIHELRAMFLKVLEIGSNGLIFVPALTEFTQEILEQCSFAGIYCVSIDNRFMLSSIPYFGINHVSIANEVKRIIVKDSDSYSTVLLTVISEMKANNQSHENRYIAFKSVFYEYKSNEKSIDILRLDTQVKDLYRNLELLLDRNKNIKHIVVLNSRAHLVAKLIEQGYLPDIKLIGYDATQENLEYLDKGIIECIIDTQAGEQMYQAIIGVANKLTKGTLLEPLNLIEPHFYINQPKK